jgi:hypothetical protein
LGKTKNDGIGDPYPISLSGRDEPVLSHKVEEYVNAEFIYYYNFYQSCKNTGLPFHCGWLDMPPWVVQLITAFNGVMEREKLHSEHKFMAQLHGYKLS